MTHPVTGWMVVQPLEASPADDRLRSGRVLEMGMLGDDREHLVGFTTGDIISWLREANSFTLEAGVLVPVGAVICWTDGDD